MRKIVRVSMWYMIIGLFFGVFYREFTKLNNYTGATQLRGLHTHTLVLGMFFFLIVLLLEKNFQITKQSNYKKFYILYNSGLGITLTMMLIHGIMTVLGMDSSPAISGFAGVGHILMTIGFGFFFNILFKSVTNH
ncbi:DUF2871 domain-containing protein [Vagococcus acidifermentans]|uniref:DUF2871 domain-containing protein n=1 Tax=Vagococcus acidifermentans TaxID=564710 RepID=A0A430AQR4_9ENTE|nr:DUF2871 domain-containing protein [Vagococcus acidifermentans]RSU10405.1 hypothetical protein CBF27_10330 [Vagococcus acidifermentans]